MIISTLDPFFPHSVKSVIQIFPDELILTSVTDNTQPVLNLEYVSETAGGKMMGSFKKSHKFKIYSVWKPKFSKDIKSFMSSLLGH